MGILAIGLGALCLVLIYMMVRMARAAGPVLYFKYCEGCGRNSMSLIMLEGFPDDSGVPAHMAIFQCSKCNRSVMARLQAYKVLDPDQPLHQQLVVGLPKKYRAEARRLIAKERAENPVSE